jgi:hypothetical protein
MYIKMHIEIMQVHTATEAERGKVFNCSKIND